MLCICVLPGFICVCGCSCTCLSMHVEVHGCAYVYMHGFTCVCRCSCTCLSVHMCVCVYSRTCLGMHGRSTVVVGNRPPSLSHLCQTRSNSGLTDMVSLGSQLVLGVPPLYPLTGQPPHAPGVLCGFLGTQSLVCKLAWPMFRLLSHLPRTMQSGTFTGNNFTI